MERGIKKLYFVIFTIALCSVFSSCSISKMRYSRGFNTNIDLNFRKRKSETTELKANKAIKIAHNSNREEIRSDNNTGTPKVQNIDTTAAGLMIAYKKEMKPSAAIQMATDSKTTQEKNAITDKAHPPVEHHTETATIFFVLGLLFMAMAPFLFDFTATIVFVLLGFLLLLLSLVFAFIGKRKIKLSNYTYSGLRLARTIIIAVITLILAPIVWYKYRESNRGE